MDIPLDYREGRLCIPIHVNGTDAWAIFDTGSDGTAIDTEFARRIGLNAEGAQKGSTVAGEVELRKAGPVEIEAGGHPFAAAEVMLLPLASQLPGLHVILGFDLLRETPFTVEYARRRILLDALPPEEHLPFLVEGDLRPTTWLEALGGRFEAHLDTGSAQGVSLPLAWVQAHAPGLLGEESRREILGDPLSSRRFVLGRVNLGGAALEQVPGEAVSAQGGSFADQQRNWANVGNGVLARFRLGVDGRRRITVLGSPDGA